MKSYPESLARAYHNDVTVHRMMRDCQPMEEIICQLVAEKEELLKNMTDLQMIAPRKITVEGETLIYRCPDHLVPDANPPQEGER